MPKKKKKEKHYDDYNMEECIGNGSRIIIINNEYHVFVQIQDGVEEVGVFKTEEKARKEWVDAMKVWNNMNLKTSDVPLYELKKIVTTEFVRIK